jgi:UDP-glucose 4-epimerase
VTVLITGGFGYLGGRLAQSLASHQDRKIILGSSKQAGKPDWLPQAEVARTHWESRVDLEEICSGVEAVVHLAGMNAQDSAADPAAALEFNGVATARLLNSAVRKGVKRFIYLSTAHVYGSPLSGMINEKTCPVPLHPYATSHRAGEDVVRAANGSGDIEGIVIRLSNAYGAPAHPGANCWMLLLNDLCRQSITTRRLILTSSGAQRRDFVTLTDACTAIRHLLNLPAKILDDGLFNVGGGWAPTVLEMTEIIAERVRAVAGYAVEIVRKADQSVSPTSVLDYRVDKLTNTGFRMGGKDNVASEIDRLIEFCLEHFGQSS